MATFLHAFHELHQFIFRAITINKNQNKKIMGRRNKDDWKSCSVVEILDL